MSKDAELSRMHDDIKEVRKLCMEIRDNQSNFVTHNESNIKTGILAAFTLFINGLLKWEDLLSMFIK